MASNAAIKSKPDDLAAMLLARGPLLRTYVTQRIPPRFARLVGVDDILQNIWISAFRAYPEFRPDGLTDAFDRWLLTLATHRIVDAIRSVQGVKHGGRFKRRPAEFETANGSRVELFSLLASGNRTPSRDASSKETTDRMAVAMSSLVEEQRIALQLRYLEARPVEEIALALDKPVGAINGLLFRGLRNLKRRMGRAGRYFSDSGRETPAAHSG